MSQMEGMISAALYVLTSLLMTALTKYAASVWRFPGSSLLLLVECIVTAGGMMALDPGYYQPMHKGVLSCVPLVTLAKAANMYLSFVAMRRVSLPVYNVLKRLQPVYAMAQDRVIRGARTTAMEQFAVFLLSAGSIITGFGDLDFDLVGYLIAIVAAGSQSLYLVLARRAQDTVVLDETTNTGLTHTDLLFYTAFYNVAIFLPLAGTEATSIVMFMKAPGQIAQFFGFMVPYVLLGAALNYTTYWCTAVNSPLTTAVAGSLKGAASTIGGVLFFGARLTKVGWIGFAVSTAGGFVYSEAQKRKKQKKDKDVQ